MTPSRPGSGSRRRLSGIGHLRLKGDRCLTLLTTMLELKGHEEPAGAARATGVKHGAFKHRQNWLDRKASEASALGRSVQPYCVIIGGGQGGIVLGARLKRLGVPTIILEKNARAGDSWRNRYKSLVLHDPVWYDHLPYLPFPGPLAGIHAQGSDGRLAGVLCRDHGARLLGLGRMPQRQLRSRAARVGGAGRARTSSSWCCVRSSSCSRPAHTGRRTSSTCPAPDASPASNITQAGTSAALRSPARNASSSAPTRPAHDMCADLWEHDADVTMVQRSPTTVVKSETLMELGFANLYSEQAARNGMTTEKADLLFASVPFRLMAGLQIPLYRRIAEHDAEFYARLGKSGFLLDFGEDGSGLMMKALRTGSGYYIDVGASDLITAGEIKLKTGVEPKELQPRFRRAERRQRAGGRRDYLCHRLPADDRPGGADRVAGGRRPDRAQLGYWVRHPWRSGPLARRVAQHVEAARASGAVVSRRQSRVVAALFAATLRCSSRRAWRGCRHRSTPRPSGRYLRRHCRRPAAFTTTAVVAVIGPR